MSNSNSTVSLTLQIKGQQAGQELKKISDQQITATKQINQQWTQIGTAQAKFVTTAKAGTQATVQTARASDGLLRTNLMMEGVLRQQSIQTRIQSQQFKQQQATVQRLTSLIHQQQQSAQQLAKWMKQVESSSKQTHQQTQQTVSLWQKGSQVVGGIAGGYMATKAVVSTPLERSRNFSASIFDATASITNGFSGMSKEQAKAANIQLMDYAKNAVRKGHGTVEGVSEAAGILSASGNYESIADLKDPLIAVAKSAFASNSSEADMAKLVQQTKQFGVSSNRTQAALDRMIASGFAGGFELKDMAQFLPVVLGAATGAGYSGEKGLNTVTTHLQLARKYTGTAGEAATNVEDLYGLMGQKHFKDAIAKNISVESGDPTKTGKKGQKDFDLTQYLVNNKLKGIGTTDAIANLMNRELSKNDKYNELNKSLSTALKNQNTEQAKEIKEAIELVIKGQFGDIFHNKQSLSAISSIVTGMKNGTFNEIESKSWNGVGSVDQLSENRIAIDEGAAARSLEQEKILAQIKVYDSINGKLGGFEKGLVDVMQNNQELAAAAIAATGALTVLAATASGIALGGFFGGKKVPELPTTGGLASNKASSLAKTAGVAAAGYVGYELFKPLDDLIYGKIAGLFGASEDKPDFVKMAIEKSQEQKAVLEQQNQLIERQNQLSADMVNKLNSLISVTQQNKPVINMGGSLMDQISQHARNEEKRHGVDLLSYGQK